jgi:hypothetical protein
LPLVRADGLATQHLRALAYCMTAPELEQTTSLQVCGAEWVAHLSSIEKLAGELRPGSDAKFHPNHTIFHGMVSRQKRALTSSAGALLIDELIEWVDAQIEADANRRAVRRAQFSPERVAAQVTLGYFLHRTATPDIDFDPEDLLGLDDSLGGELARARAHAGGVGGHPSKGGPTGRLPINDPDYRFAVVQSELYRRYLRLAVQRRDVWPLAHYLRRLARWYLRAERSEHVEHLVHTLLDRSARGLGLDAL